MRNLLVNTFLTLDGVMQAPGGPEEDPSGGFTHGGWSVTYWDDTLGAQMGKTMGKPFDLLLGRKTYEIFAAHWPHVEAGDPAADALNAATKYVASRTLDKLEWQNSHLLEGDVADAVAKLKEQPGPEIQVHGSWDLIQTLTAHNLVDEFRLMMYPIVLGTGKRLFAAGTVPAGLTLVEVKSSATGVILATYQRAGAIEYGSFAFEEPTTEEVERRQKVARET